MGKERERKKKEPKKKERERKKKQLSYREVARRTHTPSFQTYTTYLDFWKS